MMWWVTLVVAQTAPSLDTLYERELATLQQEKAALQQTLTSLEQKHAGDQVRVGKELDGLSERWVELRTRIAGLEGDVSLREAVLAQRRAQEETRGLVQVAKELGIAVSDENPSSGMAQAIVALTDQLTEKSAVRLQPGVAYFNQAGQPDKGPVIFVAEVGAVAVGEGTAGALVPVADSWELVEPATGVAAREFSLGQTTLLPFVLFEPDALIPYRTSQRGVRAWFKAGGPIMWPILLLGVLALLMAIWRSAILVQMRVRRPDSLADALAGKIKEEAWDEAEALAEQRTDVCGDIAVEVLRHRGQTRVEQEDRAAAILLSWRAKLERGLVVIAVTAAVVPLLGLLGTVSGMIETFWSLGSRAGHNVTALSGGISEALLTTQFGLAVAIPMLLVHAVLNRWVERSVEAGERVAMRVMNAIDLKTRRVRPMAVAEEEARKAERA